MLTDTD